VQSIPLVLETPSFELPETVWKKEIEILNRLSGMELDKEGEGDGVLQEMVVSVQGVVEDATGASSKTRTMRTTRDSTKQGKSKKKKKADIDEDVEEDEDEA
jgi:AP endonuclease-1